MTWTSRVSIKADTNEGRELAMRAAVMEHAATGNVVAEQHTYMRDGSFVAELVFVREPK